MVSQNYARSRARIGVPSFSVAAAVAAILSGVHMQPRVRAGSGRGG